jgi:ADP-ribose pyrophosphatase YjhB (NUDIX family)
MENDWLSYAKRLQAIATTGLVYSESPFDIERYHEISAITLKMLSMLFSLPIEKLGDLAPDSKMHPTPKVDVRGAVIENNRILLVREKNNGRWTLPGGFAEIGLSPAENVIKEILEEASIDVVAKHLYSIRHKAKGPFNPDVRDFYKIYFLCERVSARTPHPGLETMEVAFFSPYALPKLCRNRTVEEDIERAFNFYLTPGQHPLFD